MYRKRVTRQYHVAVYYLMEMTTNCNKPLFSRKYVTFKTDWIMGRCLICFTAVVNRGGMGRLLCYVAQSGR